MNHRGRGNTASGDKHNRAKRKAKKKKINQNTHILFTRDMGVLVNGAQKWKKERVCGTAILYHSNKNKAIEKPAN